MKRPRTVFLYVLLFAAVATIAYFSGITVAGYVAESRAAREREEFKRSVLEHTRDLTIGEKLQDHILLDDLGRKIRLSELVSERTILTFIEPDCGTCIIAANKLHETLTSGSDYQFFLFVSTYTPEDVQDAMGEAANSLRFVYDEDGTLFEKYQISMSPFSLVLDRNLTLLDVIPGALTSEECLEVVAINRAADNNN